MRRRLFRHEQKLFPRVVHAGKVFSAAAPGIAAGEDFSSLQLDVSSAATHATSGSIALQLGAQNFSAHFSSTPAAMEVVIDGFYYRFSFSAFKGTNDQGGGQAELRSEIPGRIIKIIAAPGSIVEAGGPLIIQEAMKMEMTLKAPARLKIAEILVQEGAQVDADAVLVRFAAAEG